MITTANRLESVQEYYFSQKLREIDALNEQGKNVISLAIGSPDLPPHPDVIKVLQEESVKPNVHGYQNYKGAVALRKAFADWYQKWYGISLDFNTEILPLIGSKEGIMHICMTYLNEGDAALVPNPGYPTYSSAVKLAGGTCIEYELTEANNYYPNFELLAKKDLSKVKLMWVNYPHMPTGQASTPQLFEQLISFGKQHNILICHDNPYSFILNKKPLSILNVPGAKEVAVELNSLSKSHNMAGWRIGVACSAAETINQILRFKSNMDSGMFLPLQLAAAKALSLPESWYETMNEPYYERRKKVFELLDALGCTYSTKQVGMFIWAKVPSQYNDGFALSDEVLYEYSIFITPGGVFGSEGNKYVRASLCASLSKIEEALLRIKNKRKKNCSE
jgi:aspartate/methionine/tyrosine aminotransferase